MSATASSRAAMRPKEFHFPLSVEWIDGRRVAARVAGKPVIEITPPPVFRGTDPSAWSSEDFLVATAASCLVVTFTGLAAREDLSYTMLKVDADGVAGRSRSGPALTGRAFLHRLVPRCCGKGRRPWNG